MSLVITASEEDLEFLAKLDESIHCVKQVRDARREFLLQLKSIREYLNVKIKSKYVKKSSISCE
ncbi:MAG: hypothetical protein AABW89_03110 [Nanoarchaeota archaeon]